MKDVPKEKNTPTNNRTNGSDNADTSRFLDYVRSKLQYCADVNYHKIQMTNGFTCTLIYISSIIDSQILKESILLPLMNEIENDKKLNSLISNINNGSTFPLQMEIINDQDQVVLSILEGKVALLFENLDFVYIFPITSYQKRSITESQNEMVIMGPQEALIEDINSNLSLLRHRIKHPDFKVKNYVFGNYTKTTVCLLYIDGLCTTQLLEEMEDRLKQIKIEGVLGVSYLVEFLESTPSTLFPQVQYSERPDTIIGSLLEGRIALLVDGVPVSVIAPVTLASFIQSAEDYHQRYIVATWIRWIRYLFVVISFLLPSLYVAVVTFHPEMLPSDLLVTISAARERLPFPTLFETFVMEIAFEGLREAGTRIPKPIGQTISIIGAIVIGQTAVFAGIVSSPVVIVVSITGIASYIIPHFELGLSFRLLRFPLLLLGGTMGLFGTFIGIFLILNHLVNLDSFGVPYMKPVGPFDWEGIRDVFFRTSWRKREHGNQLHPTTSETKKE